jgi:hypothetical protein
MESKHHAGIKSDWSDGEKNVRGIVTVVPVDLVEDPDAHLSDAERAEIVSPQKSNWNFF